MDVTKLSVWRDVAIILLTLEAIVLAWLPVLLLYRSWPTVRQLHMRLPAWLLHAHLIVWRFQRLTKRAMYAVAIPLIWLRSTAKGVHQTFQLLGWR